MIVSFISIYAVSALYVIIKFESFIPSCGEVY